MRGPLQILASLSVLALAGCPVRSEPKSDAGPTACATGEVLCSSKCARTGEDRDNCGACGNKCGAGSVCSEGRCATSCSGTKISCQGSCVDVQINSRNCGSCGSVCPSNKACFGGECACPTGFSFCDGQCVDTRADKLKCGACNVACPGAEQCLDSTCTGAAACSKDQRKCGDAGVCTDVNSDSANCGACANACSIDKVCLNGGCGCAPGYTGCSGACVSLLQDSRSCGSCGHACGPGESCSGGTCTLPCLPGTKACSGQCVNTVTSNQHCGVCGNACGPTQVCTGGSCVNCNSATTDCDGDGWTQAQGDCCDNYLGCSNPALVNPGALELSNNFVDDNCNGLIDAADVADVDSCDSNLPSNSLVAMDYAKAMGLCRTTVENPAQPVNRTWGVISAELLHADGTALSNPDAKSIRTRFGRIAPQEGLSLAVLASGIASDAVQSVPGPNGGPTNEPSEDFGHVTDLSTCTSSSCIKDWLMTANPPLKQANELPAAPSCGSGATGANDAHDSVMIKLRVRAPTNARSFSLSSFFFSSEYPEFVCTEFNDQVLVLVDTPGGAASPPNPVDKNLLTYQAMNQQWPVGINLAGGTNLFRVCQSKAASATCWDPAVNVQSCGHGTGLLTGTGFEAPTATGSCVNGGGTDWLTTVGNVRPGEIVELRFVIWDVGDGILDSLVLFDNFKWDVNPRTPGTSG